MYHHSVAITVNTAPETPTPVPAAALMESPSFPELSLTAEGEVVPLVDDVLNEVCAGNEYPLSLRASTGADGGWNEDRSCALQATDMGYAKAPVALTDAPSAGAS